MTANVEVQGNPAERYAMRPVAYLSVMLLFCLSVVPGCEQKPGKEPVTEMPGENYDDELPALTEQQEQLQAELLRDLKHLTVEIGERNVSREYEALEQAADWIEKSFRGAGFESVDRQTFPQSGKDCHNVIAEITGSSEPEKIVVVGAHYDSVPGCPGANDNGTGAVALLALARHFADEHAENDSFPVKTLRFVAFTNEEPPYFGTREMGSYHYAARCKEREENVVAMISLETIGYYTDEPDSQHYPPPFDQIYPSVGNYIGFVGNLQSADLVTRVTETFRKKAKFPSEGGALPPNIDGVGWSDHWSFWQHGYPGVMVTDTAPFRYEHYHKISDTVDKINFEGFCRVVDGMKHVVEDLAGR